MAERRLRRVRWRRWLRCTCEGTNGCTAFTSRCTIYTASAKGKRHANERNFLVTRNGTTSIQKHALRNGLDDRGGPDNVTIRLFENHTQRILSTIGRASHHTATDGFCLKATTSRLLIAGNATWEAHVQTRNGATAGTSTPQTIDRSEM